MIQVWFQGKKMGALEISVPNTRQSLVFTEVETLGGQITETTFAVGRRNNLVDEADLMRNGWTIEQHIVAMFGVDPSDCEIFRDQASMGYRVSWPMVNAENIDRYEFLFDQKEFHPC